MQPTSIFVLIASLLAPVVVANGCTHHRVIYQIPIYSENGKRKFLQAFFQIESNIVASAIGAIQDFSEAFINNAKNYEEWASESKNGGTCKGKCASPYLVELSATSYTYEMRCYAPRMSKKASGTN